VTASWKREESNRMIVAFEGIDACGKQTQVRMLEEYANRNKMASVAFDFPNYETPTGKKISELLISSDDNRDALVLQSLMTVNRYEMQDTIEDAHFRGELVILDRYWMSGWVYGQTDGIDPTWLESVHLPLIQPHQWILLDIPVGESFKRRPQREDAYEASRARLEASRRLYLQAAMGEPEARLFEMVKIIDATKPPEWIHKEILGCLEL
jgi:dTMP kinase